MKRTLITLAALAVAATASAQQTIGDVLQQVELSSKELKAQRELTDARKIEAKTGKFMANPTVEMENMWGGADSHRNSELTISQAIDFPSAYGARNQIARLQSSLYDSEGETLRQQLLLDAKTLCIEIIHLNRQQELLAERLSNAERLDAVYRRKMASGDANILECNKIGIELIAARTASSLNESELRAKEQQLRTLMGGGEASFASLAYPAVGELPGLAQLGDLYLGQDPMLRGIENEREINRRTVALNRSLSLPQFEVGYRHDFGGEGRFKGFKVGMSVPLFENKNKVKAAKAMVNSSDARLESARENVSSELRQLYDQAVALRGSMESMNRILQTQNNLPILNKALDAGQINVIEYFTEVSVLYQSRETLLQVERDYQLAVARLFRFEL